MHFDRQTWCARAATIIVLGGLALSGCGSVTPVSPDGSGMTPLDAGSDGTSPVCFGKVFPICLSAVPSSPRTFQVSTSIDTDSTGSASECDQNNDQVANYCVITGAGLTLPVGATLTAHGSKPLVLLSTTTMEIAGSIDVSSHQGGATFPGAGSNPKTAGACTSMPPPVGPTQNGGGYGGSFGVQGGNGGTSQVGTGGGIAARKLAAFPAVLRGGCSGSYGSAGGVEVQGGDGGGAVALIAAMQIHIDGTINASGAGGNGGIQNVGDGGGAGSGGGSGGMILLDSPLPLVFGASVKVWANGGSGGQGAAAHTDGASGTESSAPSTAATTPVTSGAAGTGGAGSVGTNPGGVGGSVSSGGGGAGGGGGGLIFAPGLTDPASISPPSS